MNRATKILGLMAAMSALATPSCTETEGQVDSSSTGANEAPSFDTTLGLTVVDRSATHVTVDLWYEPAEGQPGPRAIEVWLGHSSNVTFASAEPGDSAAAAQKTVVVQPKTDSGQHELRVLIYGTASLDRIARGAIARIYLDVAGGGPVSLEVLDRMPIFAPADANQGVRLPTPLVIGGD